MMALFIATAVVTVERFINRRRLKIHEVLADLGWLSLLFAFIEFGYLYFVETLTLNYGSAARALWPTEWPVFKSLLLDASVSVLLIFTSLWLESAGVRVELRRPQMRRVTATRSVPRQPPPPQSRQGATVATCDIEWHEAT